MSTEVSPPPSTLLRQRIWTSPVAHLIDQNQLRLPDMDQDRLPSLCNIKPVWPGVWMAVTADAPDCRTCVSVKEASERAGDA